MQTDETDGVRYAGAMVPGYLRPMMSQQMQEAYILVHEMLAKAHCGELNVLRWLEEEVMICGGEHMIVKHMKTYTVEDFEAAWRDFIDNCTPSKYHFTGTWVSNKRRHRRNLELAQQEKEHIQNMAQDAAETARMDPRVASVSKTISTLTDDEKRDLAWDWLDNMTKKRLIEGVRAEFDSPPTYNVATETAKVRWWRQENEAAAQTCINNANVGRM